MGCSEKVRKLWNQYKKLSDWEKEDFDNLHERYMGIHG